MNYSDSERIAGLLEKNKFKPASDINEADLVIFNTCGVRQTAEDRAYGQIHNARKNNPKTKIILTGCLANRQDVQKKLKDKVDLFVEINDLPVQMADIIKPVTNDKKTPHNTCHALHTASPDQKSYLSIAPKYTSNFKAFVPIMTGCNNFCTYCVVPYARGREISRPAKEIISEVGRLSKKNYKEITLLGQNVNSYRESDKNSSAKASAKKDKIINFPELLDRLAKKFPAIHFKFLTSHPKDFSDKLIAVISKNKNISREIHLPFQSGSDKILKAMNRPYTKKCYLSLIKKISEKIPNATFTTDVIVGFPGETEKDFQETVKIFKKVNYNEAYINKYSPRPGTAAYSLGDPLSWNEKKRREKVLRKLVNNLELQNSKFHCHCEKWSEAIAKRNDVAIPSLKSLTPLIRDSSLHSVPFRMTQQRKYFRNKIIVILGPTASGKSGTAIKLAKKFNGEIISADSRQIYRGMDIGTGKIKKQEARSKKQEKFISGGITHHMLDIVSPHVDYSVAKFKKKSEKIIQAILERNKLPIICGGTGFWIKAIVDNINFPEVKPNKALRKKLQEASLGKLFKILKKLDPERAKNIDKKNKVRLIRAIEICQTLGKVPHLKKLKGTSSYDRERMFFLQIGIKHSKENLHKRIQKNINKRFKQGMIAEVKKLHKDKKLSWKKIQSFGLSYNLIPLYLKGEIKSKKELAEKIYLAEKNYAKRQMTWFSAQGRSASGGQDKRIKWLKDYKKIEKEVEKFLE